MLIRFFTFYALPFEAHRADTNHEQASLKGEKQMRHQRIVTSFILCILAAASLQGQVLPARWEKVVGLQPGTSIIIRLKTGDRMEGAFVSLSQDAIVFTEDIARERVIPKSAVRKIETSAKAPDRLRNGALIGMLVGSAGGIGGMVAFANAKTNGPVYWGEDGSGYLVGAALVGGGLGAVMGAIVDASIKRHEVLYQAR
jgi:hypothetical protein